MLKNYVFFEEKELIYKAECNFYKKEREADCYRKYRNLLIKKGYKPLNNITYTYSFDYKKNVSFETFIDQIQIPIFNNCQISNN